MNVNSLLYYVFNSFYKDSNITEDFVYYTHVLITIKNKIIPLSLYLTFLPETTHSNSNQALNPTAENKIPAYSNQRHGFPPPHNVFRCALGAQCKANAASVQFITAPASKQASAFPFERELKVRFDSSRFNEDSGEFGCALCLSFIGWLELQRACNR